ncbi:MAG: molecular chaperone TorD family protein [Candidatus Bathyarchaeia archaeon]
MVNSKEETFENSLLCDTLKNCGKVYFLLGKIYEKEVTANLLKSLSESITFFRSKKLSDEELEKGIELLDEYLSKQRSRGFECAEAELAVDYANLFLGVKGLPHPSESAYKCGFIMASPCEEVLRTYQKANLNLKEDYKEPADHIAVELYFMANLCWKTAENLAKNKKHEAKKCLQIMKDFLNNHLLSWIPSFTTNISNLAITDFYRGLAIITKRFAELNKALTEQALKLLA